MTAVAELKRKRESREDVVASGTCPQKALKPKPETSNTKLPVPRPSFERTGQENPLSPKP